MSPHEFLVPAGRLILSSMAGWMDECTLTMRTNETRFDERRCLVEIRKSVQWA